MSAHMDCACENCTNLCVIYPGWLTPRDVRRLARHLGVTEASLFRTHLAIDTWFGGRDGDVSIPMPKSLRAQAGMRIHRGWFASADQHSRCGMLADGRCSIHAAKPRECRECYSSKCETAAAHGLKPEGGDVHARIARAWDRPGLQAWLDSLLDAAGVDTLSSSDVDW